MQNLQLDVSGSSQINIIYNTPELWIVYKEGEEEMRLSL